MKSRISYRGGDVESKRAYFRRELYFCGEGETFLLKVPAKELSGLVDVGRLSIASPLYDLTVKKGKEQENVVYPRIFLDLLDAVDFTEWKEIFFPFEQYKSHDAYWYYSPLAVLSDVFEIARCLNYCIPLKSGDALLEAFEYVFSLSYSSSSYSDKNQVKKSKYGTIPDLFLRNVKNVLEQNAKQTAGCIISALTPVKINVEKLARQYGKEQDSDALPNVVWLDSDEPETSFIAEKLLEKQNCCLLDYNAQEGEKYVFGSKPRRSDILFFENLVRESGISELRNVACENPELLDKGEYITYMEGVWKMENCDVLTKQDYENAGFPEIEIRRFKTYKERYYREWRIHNPDFVPPKKEIKRTRKIERLNKEKERIIMIGEDSIYTVEQREDGVAVERREDGVAIDDLPNNRTMEQTMEQAMEQTKTRDFEIPESDTAGQNTAGQPEKRVETAKTDITTEVIKLLSGIKIEEDVFATGKTTSDSEQDDDNCDFNDFCDVGDATDFFEDELDDTNDPYDDDPDEQSEGDDAENVSDFSVSEKISEIMKIIESKLKKRKEEFDLPKNDEDENEEPF